MVPVANRPVLEYVIESIAATDVDEILLVVGYERDRVQTHFGDGDDWDVSIRYVIQKKRLGTAHAVAQAEPHVDGPFVVLNGDRILDATAVSDVGDAVADGDAAAAMAVTRVDQPRSYGVVTVSNGRVETVVENPRLESPSELINAGVYGFTPAVFDAIRNTEPSEDGEIELPGTVNRLVDDGGVRAVPYDGPWHDVSNLWDLLPVSDVVLDRIGERIRGTVASGAQVGDRCVLAPTASVGANAVVGGGTTVGANAHVAANATVTHSVVFPDATVESGAVVRDCIVGAGAVVGANATARGGTATVTVDGTLHEGVKLGAVVGDDARVGGAAVLAPGTVVGNDAVVGGGSAVSGRLGDGETVRRG